eukprot:TRINITY_DN38364_c0_g1_i1.p1 TRINITY_DN38364_c0_g1~~TRINITY_DN38364_c0_g1_i1.p1  ORF type:complete len:416 (+),score=86.70 TRINITY_DN38364_c0_g1_i1:108-1355(+)
MPPKRDAGRGLTDRKICLAVTFGVTLGVFVSLMQLRRSGTGIGAKRVSTAVDVGAGAGELKAERDRLLREKETLLRDKDRLTRELADAKRLAEQGKGGAGTAVEVVPKVGPAGSVKSQRTNPVVTPDTSVNPVLADLLEDIAINRELVVAVSNNNIRAMLQTWFEGLKRTGITNYLVVALDDPIADFCRENGVPVYRRDAAISDAQRGTGDNHAISGLKFHLLREFLVLGYSVLLSDVDIVYLQNPFNFLNRDCDVEAMTDGFDNYTAYGYDDVTDDPSMGWARYAHTMRVFVFNSGLFYIRPTIPSIELLDRVTGRLSREKAWDQAVFNEELFFPSHPGYDGLHASRRVMDYYLFLNSKVLFKQVRKDGRFANHMPVTIHVNYHPDKYQRMLAIVDYYVNGNKAALNPFPDGSE